MYLLFLFFSFYGYGVMGSLILKKSWNRVLLDFVTSVDDFSVKIQWNKADCS